MLESSDILRGWDEEIDWLRDKERVKDKRKKDRKSERKKKKLSERKRMIELVIERLEIWENNWLVNNDINTS